MKLNILTPEKNIFSGDVYGVQLPGVTGSFEVLEKHAPLIAALSSGKLKILKDKTGPGNAMQINDGFVEVLNDTVTVLVEGAEEV